MIPGDAGKEVFHKTPNGKVRYFCGMLVGEETKEVGEMSIVKLVALTPPHTKKTQSPQKFETWKTCSFVDFLLISPAFLAIFFFPIVSPQEFLAKTLGLSSSMWHEASQDPYPQFGPG